MQRFTYSFKSSFIVSIFIIFSTILINVGSSYSDINVFSQHQQKKERSNAPSSSPSLHTDHITTTTTASDVESIVLPSLSPTVQSTTSFDLSGIRAVFPGRRKEEEEKKNKHPPPKETPSSPASPAFSTPLPLTSTTKQQRGMWAAVSATPDNRAGADGCFSDPDASPCKYLPANPMTLNSDGFSILSSPLTSASGFTGGPTTPRLPLFHPLLLPVNTLNFTIRVNLTITPAGPDGLATAYVLLRVGAVDRRGGSTGSDIVFPQACQRKSRVGGQIFNSTGDGVSGGYLLFETSFASDQGQGGCWFGSRYEYLFLVESVGELQDASPVATTQYSYTVGAEVVTTDDDYVLRAYYADANNNNVPSNGDGGMNSTPTPSPYWWNVSPSPLPANAIGNDPDTNPWWLTADVSSPTPSPSSSPANGGAQLLAHIVPADFFPLGQGYAVQNVVLQKGDSKLYYAWARLQGNANTLRQRRRERRERMLNLNPTTTTIVTDRLFDPTDTLSAALDDAVGYTLRLTANDTAAVTSHSLTIQVGWVDRNLGYLHWGNCVPDVMSSSDSSTLNTLSMDATYDTGCYLGAPAVYYIRVGYTQGGNTGDGGGDAVSFDMSGHIFAPSASQTPTSSQTATVTPTPSTTGSLTATGTSTHTATITPSQSPTPSTTMIYRQLVYPSAASGSIIPVSGNGNADVFDTSSSGGYGFTIDRRASATPSPQYGPSDILDAPSGTYGQGFPQGMDVETGTTLENPMYDDDPNAGSTGFGTSSTTNTIGGGGGSSDTSLTSSGSDTTSNNTTKTRATSVIIRKYVTYDAPLYYRTVTTRDMGLTLEWSVGTGLLSDVPIAVEAALYGPAIASNVNASNAAAWLPQFQGVLRGVTYNTNNNKNNNSGSDSTTITGNITIVTMADIMNSSFLLPTITSGGSSSSSGASKVGLSGTLIISRCALAFAVGFPCDRFSAAGRTIWIRIRALRPTAAGRRQRLLGATSGVKEEVEEQGALFASEGNKQEVLPGPRDLGMSSSSSSSSSSSLLAAAGAVPIVQQGVPGVPFALAVDWCYAGGEGKGTPVITASAPTGPDLMIVIPAVVASVLVFAACVFVFFIGPAARDALYNQTTSGASWANMWGKKKTTTGRTSHGDDHDEEVEEEYDIDPSRSRQQGGKTSNNPGASTMSTSKTNKDDALSSNERESTVDWVAKSERIEDVSDVFEPAVIVELGQMQREHNRRQIVIAKQQQLYQNDGNITIDVERAGSNKRGTTITTLPTSPSSFSGGPYILSSSSPSSASSRTPLQNALHSSVSLHKSDPATTSMKRVTPSADGGPAYSRSGDDDAVVVSSSSPLSALSALLDSSTRPSSHHRITASHVHQIVPKKSYSKYTTALPDPTLIDAHTREGYLASLDAEIVAAIKEEEEEEEEAVRQAAAAAAVDAKKRAAKRSRRRKQENSHHYHHDNHDGGDDALHEEDEEEYDEDQDGEDNILNADGFSLSSSDKDDNEYDDDDEVKFDLDESGAGGQLGPTATQTRRKQNRRRHRHPPGTPSSSSVSAASSRLPSREPSPAASSIDLSVKGSPLSSRSTSFIGTSSPVSTPNNNKGSNAQHHDQTQSSSGKKKNEHRRHPSTGEKKKTKKKVEEDIAYNSRRPLPANAAVELFSAVSRVLDHTRSSVPQPGPVISGGLTTASSIASGNEVGRGDGDLVGFSSTTTTTSSSSSLLLPTSSSGLGGAGGWKRLPLLHRDSSAGGAAPAASTSAAKRATKMLIQTISESDARLPKQQQQQQQQYHHHHHHHREDVNTSLNSSGVEHVVTFDSPAKPTNSSNVKSNTLSHLPTQVPRDSVNNDQQQPATARADDDIGANIKKSTGGGSTGTSNVVGGVSEAERYLFPRSTASSALEAPIASARTILADDDIVADDDAAAANEPKPVVGTSSSSGTTTSSSSSSLLPVLPSLDFKSNNYTITPTAINTAAYNKPRGGDRRAVVYSVPGISIGGGAINRTSIPVLALGGGNVPPPPLPYTSTEYKPTIISSSNALLMSPTASFSTSSGNHNMMSPYSAIPGGAATPGREERNSSSSSNSGLVLPRGGAAAAAVAAALAATSAIINVDDDDFGSPDIPIRNKQARPDVSSPPVVQAKRLI